VKLFIALTQLTCKLAYLSFHNQHKYCPVVNSITVDYSAFWCNCNYGGQSLHAYITELKLMTNSIVVHYGAAMSKLVWKIHTHSENQVLTNSIATVSLWNCQVKIMAWKIHTHSENQV
jgi:hypothetical protein